MSVDTEFTRREFVTAVAAVGATAFIVQAPRALAERSEQPPPLGGAAGSLNVPQLLLFDPEHADACRRLEGTRDSTCATLPITGDRVRFGQKLFSAASAPSRVAGLTHYADYILLSGCAAEHGYRVLSVEMQGRLVEWSVAKVRRSTSS